MEESENFGDWFFVSDDREVFPLRVLDSYSSEYEIEKRVLTIQADVLTEIEKRMRILRRGSSRDDLREFLLRGCFANNFVVTFSNGATDVRRRRWFSDKGDFEESTLEPNAAFLYLTTEKPDFDSTNKPAFFMQED